VGSLAAASTIIRRLWTDHEPFDFHGTYHHLSGTWCSPKPVQRSHPPILIGGRSVETLRVAPSRLGRAQSTRPSIYAGLGSESRA